MKSGFIAITGRPNAGKSTLINRIIGEKVSIVSWRPQTTRNRIIGIYNREDCQAVFIDTPGIHTAKNKLSDYMMKSINNSLQDVDVIIYLIDGTGYLSDTDRDFLNKYSGQVPIIIALNKVDEAKKEKYIATLDKLNGFKSVKSIYSISAKTGENVDEMINEIISLLPEGIKMYPDDIYTDRTMRFIAPEIIREKALKFLDEEIPYGIGVIINKYSEREDKDIIDIEADIVAERPQHKAIIIGKEGSMIKKIGEAARVEIEKYEGSKVFLKLFVKVENDWRDNQKLLEELGYGNDTL